MMEEKIIKPIHDEKVDLILKGLTEGRTREDLAEELNYKTYKSLDVFMRRRNWRWRSQSQIYEPEVPKATFEENLNKVRTTGTVVGRI